MCDSQDTLVERMFDDYFIKGLALSDKSALLSAAVAAKIEGAEALLSGDELTEDVVSLVRRQRRSPQKAFASARTFAYPCPIRRWRTPTARA